ncbi:MAG TPA: putative Ig domain-containing protein [Bryobacteraceae bacterium]
MSNAHSFFIADLSSALRIHRWRSARSLSGVIVAAAFALVSNASAQAISLSCNPSTGPTQVGVAYSTTCTVSGGTPPYAFGLNPSNVLPAGLTFAAATATTATITGTPTQAGAYSFGVFPQDATGQHLDKTVTFTGTIAAAAAALSLSCNPSTGPTQVGVAYSTTCTVSGGTPPYAFGLNPSNVLPAGLTFAAATATTATITGTPTQAGAYSFGVFPQDATGQHLDKTVTFTGTIAPAAAPLSLSCNPSTGPTQVGVAYSTTCTASGGTPPYAFGLNPTNVLPTGLNFVQASATTATITGTPTQAGAYSFGVFPQDATGQHLEKTVTFTGTIAPANPPLSLSCNPSKGPAQVGVPYSTTCTASGGTPPYAFGLNPTNVLPTGLNFVQASATTATITGTPTQVGSYSFGVFPQDATGQHLELTVTFTGTIAAAPAAPVVTSVLNGASFATGGAIASGSWVSIFGTNLAPAGDSRLWNPGVEFSNGKFPISLDSTSVTVNGKSAAVEFISPTQVNIQPPDDTAVGPVQVLVNTPSGASNSFTVNLAQFAPGLFPSTAPYLVAQHADNRYVTPTSPAKPGEVIILWGTGFGPGNPAVTSGQIFSGASRLANTVTVTIGGQPALVDFSGIVGAGLVQINVHVPGSINDGDAPVVASVGGVSSQTTANMLPVKN